MAMDTIRKGTRKCVLCANWNGAMGSTTIQAKMGGVFTFDHAEKQSCFQKGVQTPSWGTYQNFKSRY